MNPLDVPLLLMMIAMDALTVLNLLQNFSFSSALKNGLRLVEFFRNVPHIHLHEKRGSKEKWHGAEIQVVIEGNWTTYRVRGLDHSFSVSYF